MSWRVSVLCVHCYAYFLWRMWNESKMLRFHPSSFTSKTAEWILINPFVATVRYKHLYNILIYNSVPTFKIKVYKATTAICCNRSKLRSSKYWLTMKRHQYYSMLYPCRILPPIIHNMLSCMAELFNPS